MNKQNDDIVTEAVSGEKASTQESNNLLAKLQKPYTITLPVWAYALVAVLAALLILD